MEKINSGIKGGINLDGDVDRIKQYYKKWSTQYDHDMIDGDYLASKLIVDYFLTLKKPHQLGFNLKDQTIRIFDAGCGTGLVAFALKEQGYHNIDGCDLSQSMVDQAKQKGLYQELTGNIDLTLPIKDAWKKQYDALFCSGVFTLGHVPTDTIYNLFDFVKTGGLVMITTRTAYYEQYNYQKQHDQIIDEKRAVSIFLKKNAPYTSDSYAHYWGYRIL